MKMVFKEVDIKSFLFVHSTLLTNTCINFKIVPFEEVTKLQYVTFAVFTDFT